MVEINDNNFGEMSINIGEEAIVSFTEGKHSEIRIVDGVRETYMHDSYGLNIVDYKKDFEFLIGFTDVIDMDDIERKEKRINVMNIYMRIRGLSKITKLFKGVSYYSFIKKEYGDGDYVYRLLFFIPVAVFSCGRLTRFVYRKVAIVFVIEDNEKIKDKFENTIGEFLNKIKTLEVNELSEDKLPDFLEENVIID